MYIIVCNMFRSNINLYASTCPLLVLRKDVCNLQKVLPAIGSNEDQWMWNYILT